MLAKKNNRQKFNDFPNHKQFNQQEDAMKKILILGSGAGGTMVANNLCKKLNPKEWEITMLDNDEVHHYQPG